MLGGHEAPRLLRAPHLAGGAAGRLPSARRARRAVVEKCFFALFFFFFFAIAHLLRTFLCAPVFASVLFFSHCLRICICLSLFFLAIAHLLKFCIFFFSPKFSLCFPLLKFFFALLV